MRPRHPRPPRGGLDADAGLDDRARDAIRRENARQFGRPEHAQAEVSDRATEAVRRAFAKGRRGRRR